MGRQSRRVWTTPNFTQTINHTYNYLGGILESAWPGIWDGTTPLTLYYTYDPAGRQASSWWSNGNLTYQSLVTSYAFTHSGSSALETVIYPNDTTETVSYNSRLQSVQRRVYNTSSSVNRMYLQFNYQRPGDNANNGNVHHVYDLLNANNWQAFTYDKMNRMNAFSGQVNGIAQSRAYALDRYGNMSDSYNPLSFNTANNRIVTGGYGYDSAGNLTTDPQRTCYYDGENRLRLVVAGGITVGQYLYDGEGRRAKRITPQETRYYIHDALGNAVFEYKVNAGYDTFNHFHNGRLTATVTPSDNLLWVYSDHLGTPRLKATPTGGALSSDWYEPFGRAINTPADGMKYRFTAKERDTESGLDYFIARHASSPQGRFLSADPVTGTPLHVLNPQRWNRYAYAINNPLFYIDPTGRDAIAVNFSLEVPFGGHGRRDSFRYMPMVEPPTHVLVRLVGGDFLGKER